MIEVITILEITLMAISSICPFIAGYLVIRYKRSKSFKELTRNHRKIEIFSNFCWIICGLQLINILLMLCYKLK
nr:MAG TPA: hypothetical protein [Caudoviricetes sp.]